MFAEVLLPRLMGELAVEAPGVGVLTGDVSIDFQDRLKRAEVDFAISAVSDTDRDIHAEPLRVIKPLCYMREGHPLQDKKMSLKDFLAFPHVRMYLPGPSRENIGLVDEVLGERGMHRTVALETTQFSPAIGVLMRTDFLLIANAGFSDGGLPKEVVGRPLPQELLRLFDGHGGGNRVRAALLRHTRSSNSMPHQWMRRLIVKHLSEPDAE
jgi:DNA-binding transcriptional LysR family regulator